MKRILILLVLTLGIFSLAQAQRGSGERPSKARPERGMRMDPAERIERETTRLKTELGLSDQQTADIKKLMTENMEARRAEFAKRRAEMEEAGEDRPAMDREKMMAEMRAQREKESAQIKALLNEEQKVKYDAMQKEREERMRERMEQRGAPGND